MNLPSRPSPGQALMHLVAVGGVFLGGYQLTLRRAHRLGELPSSLSSWDAWVPFWPASILPYASINLVYLAAFFLCRTERALLRLTLQLLFVQIAAFICFWCWPLQWGRPRPALEGIWAQAYGWLGSFDLPHNLAPSLHIAVLVVLWSLLRSIVLPRHRVWVHAWAGVVALSALTTWQHHLLDVAGGAVLGALALAGPRRSDGI
ncbi:hypothetical protein AACH06_14295 [Ideonella sp. DXS29W]|uniref:Inositol phosphorylceramide synthase n=1 Tax=Ideonella lacteola TaxID=2984193 RepID=A0ABU9BS97_9BURK